jgi:intracellular septation protein
MKSHKHFFLISFLPAAAYWYLEENYSLQIALAGGLILALVEISLEWIFTRHVHTISKFNFFLIVILGGIALIASEGIWFKLQPFFTGLLMGGYLLYRYLRDESMMYDMIQSMNDHPPPKPMVEFMERNIAVFLILYGIFMAFIAVYASTDQWLFFKTGGFYAITLVFFILQMIYIRRRIRRDQGWIVNKS